MIQRIKKGEASRDELRKIISRIIVDGPVHSSDMESLGYFQLYQPELLREFNESIAIHLGLFYKVRDLGVIKADTVEELLFLNFRDAIRERMNGDFTPVQLSVLTSIAEFQNFSFSAPTSTGKSYVFLHLLKTTEKDVVVVVPSRALLNEYFIRLNDEIRDKRVNLLTHIDTINTNHATRSIFIVTPERCREIFKNRDKYDVSLFLYDEAQLTDDTGRRGLYFDGIVRRVKRAFPDSKCVFAHPFVSNPIAQLKKNDFPLAKSDAKRYQEQCVSQLFYCHEEYDKFYHFGLEKSAMGRYRVEASDPIEQALKEGGSVLFYLAKKTIISKEYQTLFKKYIRLCKPYDDSSIVDYIKQLEDYTGARSDASEGRNFYSSFVDLLRRGIVLHHGSLPLKVRMILEKYTQAKLCRLCFATSTLEQGVNMPFDVVVLHRFEKTKKLSVRNMIGRAGRATSNISLDVGSVVVKFSNMSDLRKILNENIEMDEVSRLDEIEEDDEDKEYKEAVNSGTLSDEFNLTPQELSRLESKDVNALVEEILNLTFPDGEYLSEEILNTDRTRRYRLYDGYKEIYASYLGRDLTAAEQAIISNAVKIMMWQVYGKTFSQICQRRYSYVSKLTERRQLLREGKDDSEVKVKFMMEYHDIPDRNLNKIPMYPETTLASDVDYDRIICDTYDYLDKLVGFKLNDVFYAAFKKYYLLTKDMRAAQMCNYIKYGTDNQKDIWLIRYGLTFEDIEIVGKHIKSIDEKGIVFDDSIFELNEEQLSCVQRFLP